MSYQVNSNATSMNILNDLGTNSHALNASLLRLSSGLRINSSADDAGGMVIADALLSQSNAFGQAMLNANDAIGMTQIADNALSSQYSILETIKTKATQAAQDGQSTQSRLAIQSDIASLIVSLDKIAQTTTYNGQSLLSGSFTNKTFQIGAYSNQSLSLSIQPTSSDKLGNVWFKTGAQITSSTTSSLTFTKPNGFSDVSLESVIISTSAGTGIGVLSEVINKNSESIGGVKANYAVISLGSSTITSGTITGLKLNEVTITDSITVSKGDSNGILVSTLNGQKNQTGVEASTYLGRLMLTSLDGRGIKISGADLTTYAKIGSGDKLENYGRISLTKIGGSDIALSGGDSVKLDSNSSSKASLSLREITGYLTKDQADAMGFYANSQLKALTTSNEQGGVLTTTGAQAVMRIADAAMTQLDDIRSSVGSAQNSFATAYTNAASMQISTKSAESNIRDLDFAKESANFSKQNILVQAGNYALAQANTSQQGVLKLLDVKGV